MDKGQRGIQSVEVGGQLLLALVDSDKPMMLRDIAALAGMSAAKAHPYLVSFVRLGLVEQDRASGRYELGRTALQMGLSCMRRLNPVRIGTEAIGLLAEEIGHTVALALWGNHGPTIVRIEEAGSVHVNMRVGSVMSLLGTATGRVFAAFLPPKMVQSFVAGQHEASIGDDTVRNVSREQAELVLAEVRQREMARAVGRPIPGVNAFSVPVFDQSSSLALVVTAIGPEGTFDVDWDSQIAAALKRCGADVSERLGFIPAPSVPAVAKTGQSRRQRTTSSAN
jgi:DNA-binding IclR family transcriptional regulator